MDRTLIQIAGSNNIFDCTDQSVRSEINNIFSGGIIEGNDTKACNYQFQYYLSTIFEKSGYKVTSSEPDFIFEYKGKKYSVAAKRLNSKNN